MDYVFLCFLPLTLKISKLLSKSEPKTPQGFWLRRDTSCINVGKEKVDKQPVGKCEEIIFISWCFQYVVSQMFKNISLCLKVYNPHSRYYPVQQIWDAGNRGTLPQSSHRALSFSFSTPNVIVLNSALKKSSTGTLEF